MGKHDNVVDFDRVQRDLELAAAVQQRMHPAVLPVFDRYAVFARTTPVTWGNGDFYDVLPVHPREAEAGYILQSGEPVDQAVFVMGDATGHGVASALIATDIRAMLRMSIRMGVYHRVLVRCLNDQLYANLLPEHFVTMWMGRLHLSENYIRGVSMGQAPFFFFHAARRECAVHGSHTFPLGVAKGMDGYAPEVYRFEPGDMLVLLTDGYIESANPDGDLFGKERLAACIEAHAPKGPEVVHDAIWEAVDAFTGGAALQDDRTALIVQRQE